MRHSSQSEGVKTLKYFLSTKVKKVTNNKQSVLIFFQIPLGHRLIRTSAKARIKEEYKIRSLPKTTTPAGLNRTILLFDPAGVVFSVNVFPGVGLFPDAAYCVAKDLCGEHSAKNSAFRLASLNFL